MPRPSLLTGPGASALGAGPGATGLPAKPDPRQRWRSGRAVAAPRHPGTLPPSSVPLPRREPLSHGDLTWGLPGWRGWAAPTPICTSPIPPGTDSRKTTQGHVPRGLSGRQTPARAPARPCPQAPAASPPAAARLLPSTPQPAVSVGAADGFAQGRREPSLSPGSMTPWVPPTAPRLWGGCAAPPGAWPDGAATPTVLGGAHKVGQETSTPGQGLPARRRGGLAGQLGLTSSGESRRGGSGCVGPALGSLASV